MKWRKGAREKMATEKRETGGTEARGKIERNAANGKYVEERERSNAETRRCEQGNNSEKEAKRREEQGKSGKRNAWRNVSG
jgi:hypothetical protein